GRRNFIQRLNTGMCICLLSWPANKLWYLNKHLICSGASSGVCIFMRHSVEVWKSCFPHKRSRMREISLW
ncbi:hypothetical protein NDU88_012095, partial [Pleurodeles waltl]